MKHGTSETLTAWVFLTPALAVLAGFGLFPIGYALFVSLHEWRIRCGPFIGWDHYERALGAPEALAWLVAGCALLFAARRLGRQLARREAARSLRAALQLPVYVLALWVIWSLGLSELIATGDHRLYNGLRVTAFYALGTIPLQLALSMALAYLLLKSLRAKGFFRVLLFLPYVTPVIASAVVFRSMFSLHPGSLANQAWSLLGFAHAGWLHESRSVVALLLQAGGFSEYPAWVDAAFPSLALVSIVTYNIWVYIGYDTVILLAGLSAIPPHYYEAAEIDGASSWQVFRNVTLPLVSPTLFFLSMVAVIGTFKAFNHIYIMRTPGARDTVDVLSVAIFDLIFEYHNAGYAAAMAFVLFVVILVLTLLQNNVLGKRVFYGD
jgi:multiple sugar transport system permease protein